MLFWCRREAVFWAKVAGSAICATFKRLDTVAWASRMNIALLWCVCLLMFIVEGNLEVKLPTIWTDEKQRWGRGREKRRVEERRL